MRQKEIQKYHVVVSSNERYMPGATVAMAGVALNASPESYFVFHLFSEDITSSSFELFQRTLLRLHPNGEVCHHPMTDEILSRLPIWATSRMAAARCLYAEILKDVDWCLYLDCDVLYLASPEEHFSYCNDTKIAIVTQEQSAETRASECAWIKSHCEVNVPDDVYFNSGVMLFNFKLMREEKMSDKLLFFFEQHPDVTSPDQDALNTLFLGRTILLPPKWNRLQIFLDDIALMELPVIHYVSGIPWSPKLSVTANGRFKLWHQFADKYVWQGKRMSCQKLFSRKTHFFKKVFYFLLKAPIVGRLFAKSLEKCGIITSATGWRNNQIKFDISQKMILQILD